MPRDYLALSIFTLVCCFLPLSLFALIKSIEVLWLASIVANVY